MHGEVDVAAYFEPGFTFAGRRSSAPAVDGGIEAIREVLGYWADAGAVRADTECIAVRGEDIQIVLASCRSIRVGDSALLWSVLDDSFVDIDHRRLGMGSRSVDDYVASITMLTEHGGRIYAPRSPRTPTAST